jgi:Protein of unknown function (DUF5672)
MCVTFSIAVIDTITHQASARALAHSVNVLQKQIAISKIFWFSDTPLPIQINIPTVNVPLAPFTNFWSDLARVTFQVMPAYVDTDFVIMIQADGFAVNADAWTWQFCQHDYVGATWLSRDDPQGYGVGNGGFCMRSRKLLQCLPPLLPHSVHHPEDVIICQHLRDVLVQQGISFAPSELADRFSIEWNTQSPWLGRSLGFHGKHGIANYYGVSL